MGGWHEDDAEQATEQADVDELVIREAEAGFIAVNEQRPATEEEIKEAEREEEIKREEIERQRPATEKEIKEAEKDK